MADLMPDKLKRTYTVNFQWRLGPTQEWKFGIDWINARNRNHALAIFGAACCDEGTFSYVERDIRRIKIRKGLHHS